MDLSEYKGKKVAVGLSGGVDSAVVALLLKKAGANVNGFTMNIGKDRCSIKDAKYIAKILDIPLTIIDMKYIFENEVIDYFVDESWGGRTPNPCVLCNMKLKFGALMNFALKNNDFYATGHYAIKKWDKKLKQWLVYRPKDIPKDQSSVLSMLKQNQLAKSIFPLGDMIKKEIKKIAKENNLIISGKRESQDLCFLNEDKGDFIEKWSKRKAKKGKIQNTKGDIIGTHNGYIRYPIGQRKGLGLTGPNSFYVKSIDTKNNILTAGTRDELKTQEFYVSAVNWVAFEELTKPISVEVIVRNKQTPHKAHIYPTDKCNTIKVVSEEPIFAVSPGQLAIFFKKDLILGGGWIE